MVDYCSTRFSHAVVCPPFHSLLVCLLPSAARPRPPTRAQDNYPSTCNAASAFLKVLISPVGNQVGLDLAAVFPQWLQWLPLNGDEDEARATHARLMTLVEQQNAAVLGAGLANLPALVRIFSDVAFSAEVSDSVLNGRIAAFWVRLSAQLPAAAIAQLQAPLSEVQRAKLVDCVAYANA